ncbi:MAG: hypothetical protein D6731_25100 [Planctomycetota bacterium]|nr:MAG: hypothetical protein D6731_25100 [Planctomycetota bacterium]
MNSHDDALHPDGFLDEDFARFRAERLRAHRNRRQEKRPAAPERPIPHAAVDRLAGAAPAPRSNAEPVDDFERFRRERLRARAEAEEAPPPEEGVFFGTSARERRRLRAEEHAARASEEVDLATRRLVRHRGRLRAS